MHLPVGISNFKTLIQYKNPVTNQGYLYVDKSLFIKAIIEDGSPVIIFTRPRRFGKTLNLSMLQYFWAKEVNQETTKNLFNNLNIAQEPACMAEQGKYPVIFISFKDIKQPNFQSFLEKLKSMMAYTYNLYKTELFSNKINKYAKNYIENILEQKINQISLESAISNLLQFLTEYHQQKPILLIDEYDTPIQEAHLRGYYTELISFFRNFLSEPLKDNNYLNRAILTGILRVSKESLFSGLSNVTVYSVLHNQYSDYFGFTEQETSKLLTKANLSIDHQKTKEWYNGYNFGGTTIYNPWSIIEFIKENGKIAPYWINTSGNELIRELLNNSDSAIQDKMGLLISGNTITEIVDEHIVFQDLNRKSTAIWSLFCMSGYLKIISATFTEYGNMCELTIPNQEVEFLYKQIFREWLSGSYGIVWYQELLQDLITGDIEKFETKLQTIIYEMASYHDTSKTKQEVFYQGLMLGILAGLKDEYEIKSNRESGKGRYDLIIIPKNINKLGIIMEFKAIDTEDELMLEETCLSAIEQIKNAKYITELESRNIDNICLMGIAFSGKTIVIFSEFVEK